MPYYFSTDFPIFWFIYREMRNKGDLSGCKNTENKAKKKGKFGWNVGKPKGRRLPLSESGSYGGSGNQGGHHKYASYRCGHWHRYYVGKGREKVKINWVNPTEVRPDLPVRESA